MLNGPSDWPRWCSHVLEAAYYYGVNAFFTTRDIQHWSTLQHQLFERLWEDILEKIGDNVFAVLQAAGDADFWALWDVLRACCDEDFKNFIGQPLIDRYNGNGEINFTQADITSGLIQIDTMHSRAKHII
ncbi:GTP cyclohydrolase II [Ascosphaera pollenicola]|nr:GTP cyclohydrolase II [Ascosphaera pollenicola]